MTEFVLIPVLGGVRSKNELRLPESATPTSLALQMTGQGELSSLPADVAINKASNFNALHGVIGLLRRQSARGEPAWFLAAKTPALALNGVTPLLPLVQLTPGDVISVSRQAWFVTRRWTPTPVTAPDAVAHKPCPVCGVELSLAPVVQCPCGRWSHLERPEAPDNADVLNCFLLSKTCGGCQRPTTLEPQLIPEPPEVLRALELDDES